MQSTLKRVASSRQFSRFITVTILVASVLVGIESYPEIARCYGAILHGADQLILWIFVSEVVVKMGAEWPRPQRYFLDPWNVFDFIIVAACFLPFSGGAITVLRLFRLLRVLKLVRALPKLQILVGALIKSIPSMGYVSLLLLLLFYVYAVAAVFMFGENDPIHFGSLQIAMLSLFRAVTLEDWTDLMYINMYGCSNYGYGGNEHLCTNLIAQPMLGAAFFVSFVLLGTMVILDLFIGVIMSGMDEARSENERETDGERRRTGLIPSIDDEFHEIEARMNDVQDQLLRVRWRLSETSRDHVTR